MPNSLNFSHPAPRNLVDDLVELGARFYCDDEGLDVFVSAVFGITETEINGVVYKVGLARAFLYLELEGCEPVLGTRHGETSEHRTLVEETETKTNQFQGGIGGSALSSEPSFTLSAEASASSDSIRTSKKSTTAEVSNLRLLPGNRWEIVSQGLGRNDEALNGPAIPFVMLTRIYAPIPSNRSALSLRLVGLRRDLRIETQGNKLTKKVRVARNREAVIAAVFAKAVARQSAGSAFGSDQKSAVFSEIIVEEE